MSYVYTFKYRVAVSDAVFSISFVSSASFEVAVRFAVSKARRQHPSDRLEPVSFVSRIGTEVSDNEQSTR